MHVWYCESMLTNLELCHNGQRFNGLWPERGYGEMKEVTASNNNNDIWNYAKEGTDVGL